MLYYSTNGKAPRADLRKAVIKGLAEDRGLYMPERIARLPEEFFRGMGERSFVEIAYTVAEAFFGDDVPAPVLRQIVEETLSFDCPLREVEPGIYALELFHGPTLAFKDVGARFMARLLRYFTEGEGELNVLVATSGDTGSAVANGFLGIDGIHVYVLYPKGKVSPIQECQFTTLGRNITALEIDGVFDDCQALVKAAFMDPDLNRSLRLTSANSINVARFLPQSFYYFGAYAQLQRLGLGENVVCSVPSGNFGNICSALFGKRMGLPIRRFIAANNANSVFYEFLQTGEYRPRPSIQTIANAMDVGDPSNFARIWDLYGKDADAIRADISGATYTDVEIAATVRDCYARTGYLLDPHGACGYRALKEGVRTGKERIVGERAEQKSQKADGCVGKNALTVGARAGQEALKEDVCVGQRRLNAGEVGLRPGEVGFFCETAHPAKFKDTIERIIGEPLPIPPTLAAFMQGTKQSVPLPKDFGSFKTFLLSS